MNILTCDNVSIRYDSGYAVRNTSFVVERGDFLCIVGENGSGKTTLMKGMLGLVKPAEGRMTFHDLSRNEIGYMPQQSVIQKDFPASVFEVVVSGRLNKQGILPFYVKKDRELANFHIKKLGIDKLRTKSYRDLSGGQQQRVLLARALCAAEKLIMLDEPSAGLDPVVSSEMYAILRESNQAGITVVMISHDINNAVQYGNKILHMKMSPVYFGPAEEYVHTDAGRRMLGMGVEYA